MRPPFHYLDTGEMIDFKNLANAYVPEDGIAPEFDADYYRALFPDLRLLPRTALKAHFDRHGRGEGRSASPCDFRQPFVSMIREGSTVLEIGPFTLPTLRGANVRYFDVLDADGLRARAQRLNYPIQEPVRVDYVSKTGDLAIVSDQFDVVYSAHCIEHTPDLLAHLAHLERILHRGGRYMITIPDKRFTFDHFRPLTEIHEVLDAHKEHRRVHTEQSVIAQYVETTHNDPAAHWRGEHGDHPRVDAADRLAIAKKNLSESKGEYIDVHSWIFDPSSFRKLMDKLWKGGHTRLSVERVYTTPYGENEFNAVLKLC